MCTDTLVNVGYYGKVPARGDFLQHTLSAEFVEIWSEWLQAVIAVSKEQMEEAWLEHYLTSPVWHFALSPGVCGESTVAGSLMPSVDSAGRYFYFTLAAEIAATPLSLWQQRAWSVESERKILKLLDDDTDVVRWAKSLNGVDWFTELSTSKRLTNLAQGERNLIFMTDTDLKSDDILSFELSNQYQGRQCIWWTNGLEGAKETCVITENLPLVSQFAAMIDGKWEAWGW
ncbi:type VI secretion system-associated protein TagF [Vibrio sp. SCSIO 43136]|uniref:type VI secretion system-associated protein TagF n=1 Tax=Vibrio sp. SCSIO 43136 TaxID=2819101 RepID=UPI002075B3A4|nr:type VI secretion system-associated protein TagF [Vibrio sp. SCSIO 43136]USD67508.1 type VI secretion system-associated protein TagF [Vibrio sp. SCSIO 43136]